MFYTSNISIGIEFAETNITTLHHGSSFSTGSNIDKLVALGNDESLLAELLLCTELLYRSFGA